jgi:hypothetical protein
MDRITRVLEGNIKITENKYKNILCTIYKKQKSRCIYKPCHRSSLCIVQL